MKWPIVALAASSTMLISHLFSQTTAGRPLEEPSAARDRDVAMVVEGHNSFAIDMYNELGKEPGNLFFSPFSISMVLAMITAFDARADFSGMAGSRGLWIDEVVHEARVEVNEEGTEAAAATAVVMKKMHPVFRADHPFLFLIRDLRNDSILFMGRLADPRTN